MRCGGVCDMSGEDLLEMYAIGSGLGLVVSLGVIAVVWAINRLRGR